MKQGFVISDWHIFAGRSSAERHLEALRQATAEADFIVLNGDMFDFEWSTLSSTQEGLAAAIRWLEALAQEFPACVFHYVLGNHDNYLPFIERVDALAAALPNFRWHPTHLRLGNKLFIHGDLVFYFGKRPFERRFSQTEKRRHLTWHKLYDWIVRWNIHRIADLPNNKRRSARRIVRKLRQHPHPDVEGVTDIYFGHTHVPFRDFLHEGYRFHNTGAAVHGIQAHMLPVTIA